MEDARYLSTKPLEWAAKTQLQLSVGTVAHAVSSSVWSTEIGRGVHQAVAADYIGCWSDQKYDAKEEKGKPDGGFALLLYALDDDLDDTAKENKVYLPSDSKMFPPRWGNFFSAMVIVGITAVGSVADNDK